MTLGIYAEALRSKSRRPQAQRALAGTSGALSDLATSRATSEREPETAQ
jgi:hypothetical protein